MDMWNLIPKDDEKSVIWNQQEGLLVIRLRPPGPSYSIDHVKLGTVLPLLNAKTEQRGSIPVVHVGESLVRGAPSPLPVSFSSGHVLKARVPTNILQGHVEYFQSTAYARPQILLRLNATYDVMYGDVIRVGIPTLTTCTTFWYEGNSSQQALVTRSL